MTVPRLLVSGGTVWTEDGSRVCDVLVEEGRIAGLVAPGVVSDAEILDASGLQVLPGLVDMHVHVDDSIGAFELADTFPSASRVAVGAGITTMCAFATQRAGETIGETARRYAAKVPGRSLCDVYFHLTPIGEAWDWAALQGLMECGWRTIKLYTTYREAGLFSSWDLLARVMRRLTVSGGRVLLHCEDEAVLRDQDPGRVDLTEALSHTLLRPELAEVTAIRRAVALALETGCQLHVVHVSTADGVELIDSAREHRLVTCETGPQYLWLDSSRLSGETGHRFLCTPPLRSGATRERMLKHAVAGMFDAFATDHCPFRRVDKDASGGDFRSVPNGLAGLGALPGLSWELLGVRHALDLAELVQRLSTGPARLAGLYPRKGVIREGSDADVVVVNPWGPRQGVRSTLADAYEPYEGLSSPWSVRHVLVGGTPVVRDGMGREPESRPGRCLPGCP